MAASASAATTRSASPYWRGDFENGDYCQFATVFESTSVNGALAAEGYLPACPQYTPFARDARERVYLTHRPPPPSGTRSTWVSHQEIRTTDGPWYEGSPSDRATIRLTTEQTFGGAFAMGIERWFRVSFYLPNPGFNWPADSWYTLLDLHHSVTDPAGHDWPTIDLNVSPTSGRRRYVALYLDGVQAGSNEERVKLLALTRANGARIARSRRAGPAKVRPETLPFNRWHTIILGVKFSDQGRVGDSPGWVKVIFDGKPAYAKARPNVWAGETGVWLQLQNYKAHGTALAGERRRAPSTSRMRGSDRRSRP